MSTLDRRQQLDRAQAHAAAEALQPRGQYPALLARIAALEKTVTHLAALIEQRLPAPGKAAS